MKVATKLSAAFCLLIAVLAGLLVYHARVNRAAVSASFELAEIASRTSLANTRQIAAINQLEESAEKYWVTRDAGYLELFQQSFREFETGLLGLASSAETVREREEIEELRSLWERFRPTAQAIGGYVLLSDPPASTFATQLSGLRRQTRAVTDALQASMDQRLATSVSASRRAEHVSWIVGASTLLLMVLVFTVIVRSISKGLNRLQTGTHQVAIGNFDYRIPMEGGDEFAQLANDFNLMTRRIGELDRMKRDFLSKVSHDLKTPLASMRETVQLMLDEVPGPITSRQRRLLDLTNQSARRLSAMITKILDLSAMEVGALVLEFGEHDAAGIVATAAEALGPGDPAREARIEVNLSDPTLVIVCDHDRTVQVIVNLLENAIKFSDGETHVRVGSRHVRPDDSTIPAEHRPLLRDSAGTGGALITVTDRGPGVPDADKRRIFDDFYQSGGRGRGGGRGVGLGLAICREIIDLHGGAIWVSDAVGGGSTFAVLLPNARVVAAQTLPPEVILQPTPIGG